MTPASMIGMASQPNPDKYSNFSSIAPQASQGQPEPDQDEQSQPTADPVKQLTDRFSIIFRQVQNLAADYKSDDQGANFLKDANNALSNWFKSAVQQVNGAANNGNSNY